MKNHLIFTGSGPIMILHTYQDISDDKLIAKLASKGIKRFIAFEINGDELKQTYGHRYEQIAEDVSESEDLRVLDYDGHRILKHFDFNQLQSQTPFYHG